MFENPRRGRKAINFTRNVPKILDLKSDIFRKLSSGAPAVSVFFLLEAVLISAGNFLTIDLFAKEKKLRKKSLLLLVNMAFADLISGTVCLPLFVYLSIGPIYRLWKWDTSYTKRCVSVGMSLIPPSRRYH